MVDFNDTELHYKGSCTLFHITFAGPNQAVSSGDSTAARELSGQLTLYRDLYETELGSTEYFVSALMQAYEDAPAELENAAPQISAAEDRLERKVSLFTIIGLVFLLGAAVLDFVFCAGCSLLVLLSTSCLVLTAGVCLIVVYKAICI